MWSLDDRVLFPSAMLGGLARLVLDRHSPDVRTLGLKGRGYESVVVAATRHGIEFDLGVRFKTSRNGTAFVKSMHRQCSTGDGFGGMSDDRRMFYEDIPSERVVLVVSRHAYRSFWETGLAAEWDRAKLAHERRRIGLAIDKGGFEETFSVVMPSGSRSGILPLSRFQRVMGTAA